MYYRDDDYREDSYRYDNYRDMRDTDYRDDRNYRDNYRDSYRDNYRDRYGRNYRDRYGRNYRSGDVHGMLSELVDEGMELARGYEEAGEMITNSKDKNMLMKIAEREKENYRTVKEMLEKGM